VLEGLPGPGLEQDAQLLVGQPASPREVDPEHGVLLRPVADPGHVRHPPSADVVEDEHLLGQPDRVVQGQHDHGDGDGQRGGAGGQRGGQHHG
jgi:hypothetical protein